MPQQDVSDAAVAKAGNVFAVTGADGSLPAGPAHALGVYVDDGRHLATWSLHVDGEAPRLLAVAEHGATLVHELATASVRLRLERTLDAAGAMHDRLVLDGDVARIALRVGADFAPLLAVRGLVPMPARAAAAEPVAGGLRLAAEGRDGVRRTTTVTSDPPPVAVRGDVIELPPARELRIRYAFAPAPRAPAALPGPARITVDHEPTQRIVDRAFDDLAMLRSDVGGHAYLAAGVPWYATLFGRDSLIAAVQTLALWPELAAGTLRALAERLGTTVDPAREEEPGKVLHELRVGEAAAAGLTPLARYYGTVDATPLWLCLLAEHARWQGPELLGELAGAVDATLAWIGDDVLTYRAGTLRNQGWKDSDDGVCDVDGRPLDGPIAVVEAQGYAIRAKRAIGRLRGDDRLLRQADALAARLERFRIGDAYAMALDGDGTPSRAIASNQGHLLWAGALAPDRAAAVRDVLLGGPSFSGWGIRTLAAGQPAYDPQSYHRGSVWPHDTALTAAGLRAYGFDDAFATVAEGLLDAAGRLPEQRLPELFAGTGRDEAAAPISYPAACRPQAWAAGAIPQLLVCGLGLEPDLPAGVLHVRRPWLPRAVNRLELSGLRLAGSTVALTVARGAGGAVEVTRASADGPVQVRSG